MATPTHLHEGGDASSIQTSIDAIDLQVGLVDSDVRRVLSALHGGAKGATYSGRSSATPEGEAFLQQELKELMAAKARYKEIKLARIQLQRDLPLQAIDAEIARVDAEVRTVLGAMQGSPSPAAAAAAAEGLAYAGESKGTLAKQLDGLMDEKALYKEKKLSIAHKGCEEKVGEQPPANLGGMMWTTHAARSIPRLAHFASSADC